MIFVLYNHGYLVNTLIILPHSLNLGRPLIEVNQAILGRPLIEVNQAIVRLYPSTYTSNSFLLRVHNNIHPSFINYTNV